jgi:phospho-N-acetylmuramoyl-pentapeptide-transferase
MLYYLFDYLDKTFDIPGAGLFHYISFRAGMAIFTSLLISMVFGGHLIRLLQKRQVGETIRDLGLEGQMEKQGTPTMGGLIILGAILIPTLLFAKLNNIYIILILFTTVWLGLIGFLDDYIKVFKKDKGGLAGKFKIMGQVILGLVVGSTLYFSDAVVIKEKSTVKNFVYSPTSFNIENEKASHTAYPGQEIKSTKTTIPFIKNHEFDYAAPLRAFGEEYVKYAWLIFIPVVMLIIAAVSNGANLTDGMDGLATGTSAIIGATLGILAYVSGNTIFADYLNIMYIPNTGELTIFLSAFIGACVGFLWYNTNPAQVFMGDTGSLAIGGIIAVLAIMIRKELLIPIFCGIFLAESVSVIVQVAWFKYTKRKYGEGKRVFLMSPLHHHFQKKGYAEPKIVMRFFIVGISLAIFSIITLKLR